MKLQNVLAWYHNFRWEIMRLHEHRTTEKESERPGRSDILPLRRTPVPYGQALAIQDSLAGKRRAGEIPDTLWLLEHERAITLGAAARREHLLLPSEEIARRGYGVHSTRRGGDITCHEPGQLVAYPIVLLEREDDRDLHLYLRRLEEAVIRLLARHGLEARRVEGRTGVWLGEPPRKIAAMGVRCAGWVTSHGIAINVENDLEGFRLIVPCGIADAGVTSLRRELGDAAPSWEAVCGDLHALLEETLERPLRLVYGEVAP